MKTLEITKEEAKKLLEEDPNMPGSTEGSVSMIGRFNHFGLGLRFQKVENYDVEKLKYRVTFTPIMTLEELKKL